uniref:Cilia- and flagella-associated protein 36 n=1 Tax=Alexandrium monilatum TaxID=311494 RepID=A0A7S4R9V7_9DINO|mmetsp:Transcript_85884/g.256107  ORF Transcript_85884/g.256107 Transcript_85884/m.256107 type:complete len:232 (-) Transcript_85884:79-774(-)|eukprot:CAMPEP_0175214842 /NCGR_PEP_ID=MMETSP0093-20121207/16913_1 /TAXON_ID=311494 /ORGANISM="Alexandrium monilatum, Strain CCMP3105" /LENGTH=231 /DNA_ID=CAMNT_0016508203 /DNA_START=72 /DNA_END=767 /DNA_ORIENTATION=+
MGDGTEAEQEKKDVMLVDMLVHFTHLPSWHKPINEFIREKCVLFDNFQEENKHEYVEIQNEFKILVDNLLTAHLLEVEIDPEAFEKELADSDVSEDPRFKQVISQLMAAEDFMVFKQLMIDTHCTMQVQAETTFEEMSKAEEQARQAAAAAAQAAAASAAAPAAGPPAPAGEAPKSPAAATSEPTAAEERAFGAGGGFYGRATMGTGGKKGASNERAAAIRKALLSAAQPK